jgi:proteasome lid subunit RPN8/RPN11
VSAGALTRISAGALATVRDAAIAAYPGECCGVLEGYDDFAAGARTIQDAVVVKNAAVGARFLIDARAVRQREAEAALNGRVVLGFFHSHPNGSTEPSRSDRDGAWPWFSYVIVAAPDTTDVAAWRLQDSGDAFEREPLLIVEALQ